MSYRVINLEESPRYENAPATTPYRVSTINTFFPLQSAVINVVSNAGFPVAGTINLAGALVTYTGKSADGLSFTGCGNHAATTGGEAISDVLPVGTNKWTFTKRQGASVGGIARTAQ